VFGARLEFHAHMGRFMRYDDLRSGPLLERLHVSRDRDAWTFDAESATRLSRPGLPRRRSIATAS
jgi:hypothetical protein